MGSRSNQGSSLEKIKGMCKFEHNGGVHFDPLLAPPKNKDYNEAIRFLKTTFWAKLDEQIVSLGCLDAIFI